MNDIVFGYLHCGRKMRFRSEIRAKRFADRFNKKKDEKIYPYFCKICEGWHNGHPNNGREEHGSTMGKNT
jgi:hypothetical protein